MTGRGRTPFRRRDPITLGAAGLVTLALLVLVALNVRDLPLVGQGPTYTARFSEAAGIQADDDVRVAGVRVGRVTGLRLQGRDVVVSFKAPDAWVGDRTSASIEIKTVLGQRYLGLQPAGTRPLDPATGIPRGRTTAPYDVLAAFSGASAAAQDIDTGRLSQSLGVLSQTLGSAAGPIRPALDGLGRLSRTVASRDQELTRLLANARVTSGVLADRDAQLNRLLQDGTTVLGELRSRKQAVDDLLAGTQALAVQLSGLVADNRATLGPALAQLDGVLTVLAANSANLENGLRLLAPFARQFAAATGSGRWFDAYVCNLDPPGDTGCAPGSGATDPVRAPVPAPSPQAVTRAVDRVGAPLLSRATQTLPPAQLARIFPDGVPLVAPSAIGGGGPR